MSDRFWAKVDKSGPIPEHAPDLGRCWLWTACVGSNGYGLYGGTRGPSGSRLAHRISYTEMVGAIPDGLEIDHLCRVRHCVRPSHLEAVTGAENKRRAFALVTHCPQGHEMSGDNVRIDLSSGYPCRHCLACQRERLARLVLCECGRTVRTDNLAAHRRRTVHVAAMAS